MREYADLSQLIVIFEKDGYAAWRRVEYLHL